MSNPKKRLMPAGPQALVEGGLLGLQQRSRIRVVRRLESSPGARQFYDEFRARGIEHNDALRRLANRLVGILHGWSVQSLEDNGR